ncbi:hypothetical protein EGT36_29550, partial [Agrobacterium sp. FDAARGOS_525]|uniref:hypothetical protein n=1 Tax=Agrobacterium sp. FDAARGOS_525 TaxID=2420311 RepID=UPI000FA002A6
MKNPGFGRVSKVVCRLIWGAMGLGGSTHYRSGILLAQFLEDFLLRLKDGCQKLLSIPAIDFSLKEQISQEVYISTRIPVPAEIAV